MQVRDNISHVGLTSFSSLKHIACRVRAAHRQGYTSLRARMARHLHMPLARRAYLSVKILILGWTEVCCDGLSALKQLRTIRHVKHTGLQVHVPIGLRFWYHQGSHSRPLVRRKLRAESWMTTLLPTPKRSRSSREDTGTLQLLCLSPHSQGPPLQGGNHSKVLSQAKRRQGLRRHWEHQ